MSENLKQQVAELRHQQECERLQKILALLTGSAGSGTGSGTGSDGSGINVGAVVGGRDGQAADSPLRLVSA